MNARIDEIRRGQEAQRGLIRKFAGFYIACFAAGYFIAAVVHILTDRSAQW